MSAINMDKNKEEPRGGEKMPKKKTHEHSWIYDGKGCCYRLRCSIPGCEGSTRAYRIKGEEPKLGEPVKLLEDGETIEIIGSKID